MKQIFSYINENSYSLFKTAEDPAYANFDNQGFWLSELAEEAYSTIKSQPHLYVAFTKNDSGTYIGKSFQKGGRWKRQHAYHLGTLAYHLLNSIRYDDQNHKHWIESWMSDDTINLNNIPFSIKLKKEVFICFIPFELYSDIPFADLTKTEIRKLNHEIEKKLIQTYKQKGAMLLNRIGK